MSESTENKKHGALYGVLAEFDTPGALKKGAAAVRDAGYTMWDCFTPFPVHGLDPAMGIRRTILPIIVFCGGIAGLSFGVFIQWYTNGYEWPWLVSGKPYASIPAWVPIIFECTVLFSALTCFFSMWILNKLPQPYHPFFRNKLMSRVTDDALVIGVEAADKKFDQDSVLALLREAGATHVENCYLDPQSKKQIPTGVKAFVGFTTVLALIPVVLIANARVSKSSEPHYHIVPNMDFQPKAKPQTASKFFQDGRSARPFIDGTVARGDLMADDHFWRGTVDGKYATTFPTHHRMFTADAATMDRGEERYNVYCAPCHGESGDGNGIVAQTARNRAFDGAVALVNNAALASVAGKDAALNKLVQAKSAVDSAGIRDRTAAIEAEDKARQELVDLLNAALKGAEGNEELSASIQAASTEIGYIPLRPRSLHDAAILEEPHGEVYHVITAGRGKMMGYRSQIHAKDRWAIVLYLRALQRTQAGN